MGRINKDRHGNYWPTDDSARFLGHASTKEQATYQKNTGYVSSVEPVNELDLWEAWNAAVDNGYAVLEGKNGKQFMALSDSIIMSVMADDHGYDIDIFPIAMLWQGYRDPDFLQVLQIKYAEKPIRLK